MTILTPTKQKIYQHFPLETTEDEQAAALEALATLPSDWLVIPVRGKKPVAGPDWPSHAVPAGQVSQPVPGSNGFGLVLGPRSGVIDVEADSAEAELEYTRLVGSDAPITPTWQSSRGKHRLFRWDERLRDLPASVKLDGGLELRFGHDRAQSVLPPSGGRRWLVSPDEVPLAALPANILQAALAHAKPVAAATSSGQTFGDEEARLQDCLDVCLGLPVRADEHDGSRRLFTIACRCVEYDLSDQSALHLIREYERHRPFPQAWSDAEILCRVRDAEKRVARGAAVAADLTDLLESLRGAPDWPELRPFDHAELPAFPISSLPTAIREWVEAESVATQTPGDLPGMLALAVCSATLAKRVEIEAKPGWREPLNLFVAVLLEPGNRKTKAFEDATQPLRELETELIEASRSAIAGALSERRILEARQKKLEKQAAEKGDVDAEREARRLAEELALTPEPVAPRLLVDDCTAEKLAVMLSQQGGRLASMSAEGSVFDLMAGLYSKNGTPNFGVYLMGHAGDYLVVDRLGRDSIRVKKPALVCAYAVQPMVLAKIAANPVFRGRGLLARFLYAVPSSWIGERDVLARPVPEAVAVAYQQTVRRLAGLFGGLEATEPATLFLTPDATTVFFDWAREAEAMLADGGAMENIRDWGAKLPGAVLRIAGVLHCIERGPSARVEPSTIAAAVRIGNYLIPHAEKALALANPANGAMDDACYLLRWIQRHGKREFSRSEAQQHGKRRFRHANAIVPALEELIERGYIRERATANNGPGRPASPVFEVNPLVFSKRGDSQRDFQSIKERSKYSINSPSNEGDLPGRGNLQNIQSAQQGFEIQACPSKPPVEEVASDPMPPESGIDLDELGNCLAGVE